MMRHPHRFECNPDHSESGGSTRRTDRLAVFFRVSGGFRSGLPGFGIQGKQVCFADPVLIILFLLILDQGLAVIDLDFSIRIHGHPDLVLLEPHSYPA